MFKQGLLKQHPKHLPILALQLDVAKAASKGAAAAEGKEVNINIIKAADCLLANIDTTKLAIHFASTKLGIWSFIFSSNLTSLKACHSYII